MYQPLPLLVFFGLLLCTQTLSAQNCEITPTARFDLAGNAVTARITTGGDLWWDGDDSAYFVTDGDNGPGSARPSAIFAGGLWMAGLDPGGGLKMAAQQYGRGLGRFDYGPGPLDENGTTGPDCVNWDRFWPITREEINLYFNNFDLQNPDISVIPEAVLGWPAAGNPHFAGMEGFELPNTPQGLAPFWDEDLDGLYDPLNGDYPLFCGDQAVWCVFNDAVLHEESGSPSVIQMEVRLLAYSFTTDDEALNQTTFYRYDLVNRAQEDIIDLYAGLWIDFDLGCFTDDVFGVIPEDNLVYVHNANALDNQNCDGGVTSFQTEGVVQIAQVVHSALADHPFNQDTLLAAAPFFNNSGVAGSLPGTTDPNTSIEYYNYMQGLWRDGTPITRGGNGYQTGGDVTTYGFDGGPQPDGSAWDACTTPLPFSDRRSVLTTGPYPTLQPGAVTTFTIAMTTLFNVGQDEAGCPDKNAIVAAAREIKDVYDNSCSQSVLSSTEAPFNASSFSVSVYPNPTRQVVTFRAEANRIIRSVEVFTILGQPLFLQVGNSNVVDADLRANGLPAGTYLYRLTDATGGVSSGKVVLRE